MRDFLSLSRPHLEFCQLVSECIRLMKNARYISSSAPPISLAPYRLAHFPGGGGGEPKVGYVLSLHKTVLGIAQAGTPCPSDGRMLTHQRTGAKVVWRWERACSCCYIFLSPDPTCSLVFCLLLTSSTSLYCSCCYFYLLVLLHIRLLPAYLQSVLFLFFCYSRFFLLLMALLLYCYFFVCV